MSRPCKNTRFWHLVYNEKTRKEWREAAIVRIAYCQDCCTAQCEYAGGFRAK